MNCARTPAAGHIEGQPPALPAGLAAEIEGHVAAIAPRLVWQAIGDGIAAHLAPLADRPGLSFTTRRRLIVEAIETASRCPFCAVIGGHDG